MKSTFTLKRVTFKDKSNSEVVVITRTRDDHPKSIASHAITTSVREILDEAFKMVVRTTRPYIVDFQLYRIDGQLEYKFQFLISLNGDRLRVQINRTRIDIANAITNESLSFGSKVDDVAFVHELTKLMQTSIYTL